MSAQGPVRALPYAATKDDWETPAELFDPLNAEHGFTLDAAANGANRKVSRFLHGPCTRDEGFSCACGLCSSWAGERVWCNPPYGRGLIDWVRKFGKGEAEFAMLLLPANTDTAWFAELWKASHEIIFLTGRVNFVGSRGGNTGGSLLAVRTSDRLTASDRMVTLMPWRGSNQGALLADE